MTAEVIRSKSFTEDAARLIEASAANAFELRGRFRISLCGGSTPQPVYELLARNATIDWRRALITFGDERCVPPDHPDSNFGMVRRLLLEPAGVPALGVLRMRGELDPARAASDYESRLADQAAADGHEIFTHDLILLGMGSDGHTASLFPGTPALKEKSRLVAPNFVPKLKSYRLTFTYPLINQARHVCFLVNDPSKDALLGKILSGKSKLPAARVAPVTGRLTWLVGSGR